MEKRVLRANELHRLYGLARTTVWRLERAGDFPRRRMLTAGSVGWLADEIEEWLRARPVAGGENPDQAA